MRTWLPNDNLNSQQYCVLATAVLQTLRDIGWTAQRMTYEAEVTPKQMSKLKSGQIFLTTFERIIQGLPDSLAWWLHVIFDLKLWPDFCMLRNRLHCTTAEAMDTLKTTQPDKTQTLNTARFLVWANLRFGVNAYDMPEAIVLGEKSLSFTYDDRRYWVPAACFSKKRHKHYQESEAPLHALEQNQNIATCASLALQDHGWTLKKASQRLQVTEGQLRYNLCSEVHLLTLERIIQNLPAEEQLTFAIHLLFKLGLPEKLEATEMELQNIKPSEWKATEQQTAKPVAINTALLQLWMAIHFGKQGFEEIFDLNLDLNLRHITIDGKPYAIPDRFCTPKTGCRRLACA